MVGRFERLHRGSNAGRAVRDSERGPIPRIGSKSRAKWPLDKGTGCQPWKLSLCVDCTAFERENGSKTIPPALRELAKKLDALIPAVPGGARRECREEKTSPTTQINVSER